MGSLEALSRMNTGFRRSQITPNSVKMVPQVVPRMGHFRCLRAQRHRDRLEPLRSLSSRGHTAWRWWDYLDRAGVHGSTSGWGPGVCEHASDQRSGTRGAGRDQASPALSPQMLAGALVGRPGVAARLWRLKRKVLQSPGIAEVGEFEAQTPAVVIVGHVILRR